MGSGIQPVTEEKAQCQGQFRLCWLEHTAQPLTTQQAKTQKAIPGYNPRRLSSRVTPTSVSPVSCLSGSTTFHRDATSRDPGV